jgi:hypothetical protein
MYKFVNKFVDLFELLQTLFYKKISDLKKIDLSY